MSVESEIKTKLNTDVTVTAILSTRIYPLILPQNPTLPAAQYAIIDGPPTDNLAGKAGLYRFELQIDIFANRYKQAVEAENVVRKSLQGYTNIGSGNIQGIYHLMSSDDYEKEIANFKKVMRFSVWYGRENP